MNLNIENKNALVCGASRGLGKATAIELALMGANVTLLARNEDNLKKVRDSLDTSKDQKHDYILADFSLSVDILKQNISNALKQKNFHILINNTGGPKGGNLALAANEDLTQAFHNHIITAQTITHLLKPGMIADDYGRIINIVSTSVRQPIVGIAVSNVIRGAMASWAKTLSEELASDGITVNNILPGSTNTERMDELIASWQELNNQSEAEVRQAAINAIPFGRFAEPKEIASVIAFIASPAASYVTGTSIPVDGGKIKSI